MNPQPKPDHCMPRALRASPSKLRGRVPVAPELNLEPLLEVEPWRP